MFSQIQVTTVEWFDLCVDTSVSCTLGQWRVSGCFCKPRDKCEACTHATHVDVFLQQCDSSDVLLVAGELSVVISEALEETCSAIRP